VYGRIPGKMNTEYLVSRLESLEVLCKHLAAQVHGCCAAAACACSGVQALPTTTRTGTPLPFDTPQSFSLVQLKESERRADAQQQQLDELHMRTANGAAAAVQAQLQQLCVALDTQRLATKAFAAHADAAHAACGELRCGAALLGARADGVEARMLDQGGRLERRLAAAEARLEGLAAAAGAAAGAVQQEELAAALATAGDSLGRRVAETQRAQAGLEARIEVLEAAAAGRDDAGALKVHTRMHSSQRGTEPFPRLSQVVQPCICCEQRPFLYLHDAVRHASDIICATPLRGVTKRRPPGLAPP
jgi:hypothetical protein